MLHVDACRAWSRKGPQEHVEVQVGAVDNLDESQSLGQYVGGCQNYGPFLGYPKY